jgi:hypothetical protein
VCRPPLAIPQPRRPTHEHHAVSKHLIDQFPGHLNPATGTAPSSPASRATPPWSAFSGEQTFPPAPQIDPSTHRLALATGTITSPPACRRLTGATTLHHGDFPPSLVSSLGCQAQSKMGQPVSSQCNSAPLLFSIQFIQLKFK